MDTSGTYRLIGGNPSPYSRKLRAILRYRRLPFVWVAGTPDTLAEVAQVRPRLIPILRLPGSGEYRVDSTPLAYLLEARHAERSILPPDPGDAFVCALLEDFADEWLTKLMFHHRWHEDATARWACQWIVRDLLAGAPEPALQQAARAFFDRQRGRMALVGCTPANAPLFEDGYRRVLDALAPFAGAGRFLFGSRPSLADFALYGQLVQLATDPWPQRLMRERAVGVEAWLTGLEDASGVEGEWRPATAAALREALLAIAGAEYLPFLVANARALADGATELAVSIRGHEYRQAPFAYQARCLLELRARYAGLAPAARAAIEPLLARTGCREVLAG